MNELIMVLVPAALVDWIVACILARAASRHDAGNALRERAALAVAVAVAVTAYFFVAANAAEGFPVLNSWGTQTAARLCMVLIGLLPLYWLWLYLTDRLRPKE